MGRVTINGSVAQFSCKLTIAKTMWDAKGNSAKGKSKESRDINLALDNIKAVMTHEFADKKLTYIRDLFVFASFTALSFVDIKELTTDDIVEINGGKWILSKRHKTKVNFQVKLLDIPLQIIKRYERFQEDKLVFPNLNYWNISKPLKKMIKECGISKDISFHCTRHINSSYLLKTKNLQRLSACQVTIWKPAGFSILQCSASIKRTLFSFAKVVFFSFIAKVIPLKNRVNQTSYHYCTFVAHLADENR